MFQFEPLMKYPAVLLTGLAVALLLTRLWGPRAPRHGFVDRPGGRKLHGKPTVTAGGIAIFGGFHAACAVVFLLPWKPFAGQLDPGWWWRYAVLSSGVVLLGLSDDRWILKPALKLLGQFVIGTAAFWLGVRLQNVLGVPIPVWLDFLLTTGWFLAWMNAFNLIDGMDGLATGIALLAATGLALSLHFRKSPGDVLLLLGFIGACGGFLRYNFFPAKVFLGDTGSLFLGFTLAMLAITTHSKGTFLAAIGMPLLAVGIPLFDTLLAVWRRTVRRLVPRENASGHLLGDVGTGDAEHLHHRLLRAGLKQRHVALLLYGGTCALVLTGLMASLFHDRALGILALAFLAGSYVVVRHLAWIELRATGEAVLQGLSLPVRRNRAMLLYMVADVAILSLTLLAVHALMEFSNGGDFFDIRRAWARTAPLNVGIPFLFLLMWRSYTRVWYLARISEYMIIGAAVVVGYAVASAIYLIGLGATEGVIAVLARYWLMIGMAAPLIVGSRAILRLAQDMMQLHAVDARKGGVNAERAILWGVGYRTTLFLRQTAYDPVRSKAIRILGLFSKDSAVRGHFVHGIRVVGDAADMAAFAREAHVDVIYLVDEVEAGVLARMREISSELGVRLVSWRITEEDLHG